MTCDYCVGGPPCRNCRRGEAEKFAAEVLVLKPWSDKEIIEAYEREGVELPYALTNPFRNKQPIPPPPVKKQAPPLPAESAPKRGKERQRWGGVG